MKYLIMVYSNPSTRDLWESFSDEEQAEGYGAHLALAQELSASGELIVSEALADASTARRVTVTDGRTISSDGPFAEAKEVLVGFYLVDCESMDRAVEHAARIPEVEYGVVEVRPVLDLGGLEM